MKKCEECEKNGCWPYCACQCHVRTEEALIFCSPVERFGEVLPAKDSQVEPCVDCGIDCYVSVQSLIASGGGGTVICMPCGIDAVEREKARGEKVTFMPLSDGQIRELKKRLGEING